MRTLLVVCALALVAGTAGARRHDPEKMPETRVHDLHYGDVLFYFYQDKDLEALTQLLAYEHWQRMPHHERGRPAARAGCISSSGCTTRPAQSSRSVLTQDVPTGVRNRAWFYLAKVWYARGYFDKAEEALRKINGRMSPDLEAQNELLFANVLMHQGRFDEAISLLSGWRGELPWSAYARFNLGVALVRAEAPERRRPVPERGRHAAREHAPSSQRCVTGPTSPSATPTCRPTSRRARGAPLERVRLNGPYSDKALLGVGWADAALGDYQGALSAVDGAAQPQRARLGGAGVLPRRALCLQQAQRQRAVGRVLRERGQLLRRRGRAPGCGDRQHPTRRHAQARAAGGPGAARGGSLRLVLAAEEPARLRPSRATCTRCWPATTSRRA